MGPITATLIAIALGIASCGGGDETTAGGESAGAEDGATSAEAELEPEPKESAPPPSGNAPRAEKVEIVNFSYHPDPVTIQEGGKVIWINRDSSPHTATADDGSFDTGVIDEGKLKSETFKEPGEFTYFCQIHPGMHGTIRVVPAE
ncbi:MAG TPA: plastocyanin/azurin family copper-binding protein [Solirubrobacterales bacterium]|jgi:plastocyanin